MRDDQLRKLGRLAAQGEAEALVTWLVERLRSGELPRSRLDLTGLLLGLPDAHHGSLEEHFLKSLEPAVTRPAMWFGQPNIFHMGHFVYGAASALEAATGVQLLRAWKPWVEQRHLVVGSTWGWERILLYAHDSTSGPYDSHKKAIEALTGQLEDYFSCLRDIGVQGIEGLRKSRMSALRGVADWVPDPDPTFREWARWFHGDPDYGS